MMAGMMHWRMVVTAAALLLAAAATRAQPQAGPHAVQLERAISASDRQDLKRLAALRPAALQRLAQDARPQRIEELTREILQLHPDGNLYLGSRPVDDQGRSPIHHYLLGKLAALPGVRIVGQATQDQPGVVRGLRGTAYVPVSLDKLRLEPAGKAAHIRVGDRDEQDFRISPLWPNGAMPSLCPEGGLKGALVYVGRGGWVDVEGLELRGAIALMDFAGGRNFDRLYALGCQAVVVVEDDFVSREVAENLFCNTPLPLPRFYADRQTGDRLKALATRKEYQDSTRWTLRAGQTALLEGGQVYEARPFESLFAYLPATDRHIYTVTDDDLLDRIGQPYGVRGAQIRDRNELESAALAEGQKLDIPGRQEVYTVRRNDLLDRIAAEHGVPLAELQGLNGLPDGQVPAAGRELQIPNLPESMMVFVPIDSVSVAPDEPHGAYVAANIAVALAALEHLTAPGVVRRKGLIVAFLDAEHVGGLSSRAFMESKQLGEGKLQAQTAGREFPLLAVVTLSLLGAALGGLMGLMMSLGDGSKPVSARHKGRGLALGAVLAALGGGLVPTAGHYLGVAAAAYETVEQVLDHYRAVGAWLQAGPEAAPADVHGKWLAEKWLRVRVEERRVALVDQRNLVQQEHPVNYRGQRRWQELQELIDQCAALRNETLENGSLPWGQRVRAFRDRLGELEQRGLAQRIGLNWNALRQRIGIEWQEEESRAAVTASNQEVVKQVMALQYPGLSQRPARSTLGYLLSISDSGGALGLSSGDGLRFSAHDKDRALEKFGKRFRSVVAYASVQAGWPEDFTFVTSDDRNEFALVSGLLPPAHYGDLWAGINTVLWPLGTVNDEAIRLDTPWDVVPPRRGAAATQPGAATQPSAPDRELDERFHHLSVQARNVVLMLKMGLENPLDSMPPGGLKEPDFGRLTGRVLQFNIRSGIDAQEPVPNAYVYYPALRKAEMGKTGHNTTSYRGYRKGMVVQSLLNGSYVLPLETLGFNSPGKSRPNLYAYHLDRKAAVFDRVLEEGQIGTQKRRPDFKLLKDQAVEKDLVVTGVYPLTIFADCDPMDYKNLGDGRDGQVIRVVDAVLDGEPQHYRFDVPAEEYNETNVSASVVYMEPGRQARILVEKFRSYKMVLAGPSTARQSKGLGYPVGPRTDLPAGSPDWQVRNLSLPLTSHLVAGDMLALAQARLKVMTPTGVRDQSINEAVDRAAAKYDQARRLVEEKSWRDAVGRGREAWGILVKTYPRLMSMGRESVYSAVFLMALLVPASMFLERLVVGRKGILGRLIGASVIFVLGAVYLRLVHAAFRISVSPFIIMIAFVMILMSLIVLVLCYQRFEVLVRRARASGGEVEAEEISLLGSLNTALSLGVSNLKKRPSRTLLTTLTVSVLTFSIVCFVSVSGRDTLQVRPLELDPAVETSVVAPLPPAYEGVLFREYFWQEVGGAFVNAVASEFGGDLEVTTRAHYIQREGGNNSQSEGINQEAVRLAGHPKKQFIATGCMLFHPNEVRFGGLHRAVSHQSWFRAEDRRTGRPADRFHIILPDVAAAELGLTLDMIYDAQGQRKPEAQLPEVVTRGHTWRVIGILDTAHADRLRDLNGKSLAMVDYITSAFSANQEGDITNEAPSYHLSWRRLVIMPYAVKDDVKAKDRSVAVRFPDTGDAAADRELRDRFRRDLEMRVNRPMFGVVEGKLALITTKQRTDIGGLAKIIVPVILCVLIVLNTMLGAVDERKGEVGMLGAVGLSPGQISFLLLSESTVFSVLGIVIGTMAGLLFGMLTLDSASPVFQGLSFNFTSFWSTLLALGTGAVVLLATLVPARRAAALAAPSGMANWELPAPQSAGRIDFDLPFTLTRGNAVGMMAFFRRFLLNHTDATSKDFNCRHIELETSAEGGGALVVRADMWLTPYDLDVAQHFQMRVSPTENQGVFGVSLQLARMSGTEEAWVRTNYGFLNLVRHQFLLWRNLSDQTRRQYIQEGAGLFQRAKSRAGGEGRKSE